MARSGKFPRVFPQHSAFRIPHSLFQRIVKSAIADFDLDLKSGTFAQVLQNRDL
jgi:hypothetical protein